MENLFNMKSIILLIGFGLLLMAGAVGCEEEHEHFRHEGHGGAYDGNYHGYGHEESHGWPDDYHR
jgi:hypothetical protein